MSVSFDLEGRVAIVTGASRGIGAVIARTLGRAGCRVAVCYNRDEAAARKVVDSIDGGRGLALQLDVADEASVKHLVDAAVEAFGGVDILVNNAGLGRKSTIADSSVDSWREMFDVNLLGPYLCIKHVAEQLRRSPNGRIVNISSSAAKAGGISGPDYAAAKAGLETLTRWAAIEFAPAQIPVNAVSVASVETEMLLDVGRAHGHDAESWRAFLAGRNPMGRLCAPEEVAELVAFLCATQARFLSGAVIPIHGARA